MASENKGLTTAAPEEGQFCLLNIEKTETEDNF